MNVRSILYFNPVHFPMSRKVQFLFWTIACSFSHRIIKYACINIKGGNPMNKKYQVFVSSTQKDLEDERKAIMQALLESKCIPAGMELFPAANKRSWEIIQQDILESDFYLLVIAGRYGSITTDSNGCKMSYTEKEYHFALSVKKPVIAFIHQNVDLLPAGKVETTQIGRKRLEKFKKRILDSNIQAAFWKDSGDLISKIKSSIQELIRDTPSAGWIKGTDLNSSGVNTDFLKRIENIGDWRLEKIFKTRAEKNAESDPQLEGHDIKRLDGIAFGLSSFRSNRESDVLYCLQNGMHMRLLAMNPYTEFVKQRATEENVLPSSISDSIIKLVEWVNKLNGQSTKGKIEIKYYNAMTLDFYWRMDDVLYVGPYMYDIVSQQTITFKFVKGGKGFTLYTRYFDKLWNNENLCHYPAEFVISQKQKD